MVDMLTDKDKVFVLQHDVRIRDKEIQSLKQAVRELWHTMIRHKHSDVCSKVPCNCGSDKINNAMTKAENNPTVRRVMQEGESHDSQK